MNSEKDSDLLSYEEASSFLNVPINSLYSLVCKKRIPHLRLGRRFVRFSKRELQEWLNTHRIKAS